MKIKEDLKVLVTGGTGFIGSHLVEALIEKGIKVRVFVRDRKKLKDLFREDVEIIEGDLLDPASIEKGVKGVDMVFHLASVINVGNVSDDYYYRVNVEGTKNLLKASLKENVKKFIFSSSVNVYPPISREKLNEDSPCAPNEILGRTKLEAEKIIKNSCEKSGMNFVNLRISRVYGPRDLSLLKLFKQINSGLFFMIGNGNGLIQPIFIKDVVGTLILSAEKDEIKNETIIIAGSEILTKREFCNEIAAALGRHIPSFYIPVFLAIPPIYLSEKLFVLLKKDPILSRRRARFFLTSQSFNTEKARRILNFEPKVNVKEGIGLTVEWYREKNFI